MIIILIWIFWIDAIGANADGSLMLKAKNFYCENRDTGSSIFRYSHSEVVTWG